MHDRENILSNHALNQEFVSASLSMDSDYDAVTRTVLADVNGKFKSLHLYFIPILRLYLKLDLVKQTCITPGALILDHENKKAIDSMTTSWLEQLNSLQDKHGKDVSNIHVQAEKNLVKDYLVHILGSYFVFFVEFLRNSLVTILFIL